MNYLKLISLAILVAAIFAINVFDDFKVERSVQIMSMTKDKIKCVDTYTDPPSWHVVERADFPDAKLYERIDIIVLKSLSIQVLKILKILLVIYIILYFLEKRKLLAFTPFKDQS